MHVETDAKPAKYFESLQQIAAFLKDEADKRCKKNLAGIAIGVIVDGQELSVFSGWADAESDTPVSDSTIFEVGSLSKLFTSLLLAVAANNQELDLDDPVQSALGDAVTLPTDGKAQITFRSLANHRSSLPRLPDDLIATADMENPYVHYDQEMFYACLNRMETVKPIGSQGVYSNFAVGLLGHALGKISGSDYRVALNERVLTPLGMLDTSTETSAEQKERLATAHKRKNKPTKHWDFSEVTVAAGGVRSSLSDMFKFLRANITPATSKLSDEIMMMREPSERPDCGDASSVSASQYVFPIVWLFTFLAIFAIPFSVPRWFTGFQPGCLWIFPISLLTFGIALRWGGMAGLITAMLSIISAYLYGGEGFAWFETTIFGVCFSYVAAEWKRELESRGGGEGRLAWQSSNVDSHPMLWHNGMVGGSASFLGIVPGHEIGVVVLTNTAKPVDALGVNILTELLKHQDIERQAPQKRSIREYLARWMTSFNKRLRTLVEQMI